MKENAQGDNVDCKAGDWATFDYSPLNAHIWQHRYVLSVHNILHKLRSDITIAFSY